MPRPVNQRIIAQMPSVVYFKPRGVPMSCLEQTVLTVDELEAIRLAYLEGLYQADAAAKMSVSRQTFGRIIDSANKKIADSLVNGKAIKIEGGHIEISQTGKGNQCRWKNQSRSDSEKK
ncbi:MAG: hypothetical protein A2Y10_19710 [Planctomycetes bacterium GWF2_41_51]|nr:MAG: hypothetical protein A2Y10_19710 [Planctomycetes bacterium GWF2_41_51]HBG28206.1 hypothetical protein [Phycisphaerales bacterium]